MGKLHDERITTGQFLSLAFNNNESGNIGICDLTPIFEVTISLLCGSGDGLPCSLNRSQNKTVGSIPTMNTKPKSERN